MDIVEIPLGAAASAIFPGVRVLQCEIELGTWQVASAPDWRAAAERWQGWSKADVLAHPEIAPFCAFFKALGLNPASKPPSFANFILRAFTKPGSKIPSINPVVDHVNAFAVDCLCSLGVFDAAAVEGELSLDLSVEGDCYEPIGGEGNETIEAGNLVLRDSSKVLSLFAVRDSVHQMIMPHTRRVHLLACIVPGIDVETARATLEQAAARLRELGTQSEGEPSTRLNESTANSPWFGRYGGAFIPETLSPPLAELTQAWREIVDNEAFQKRYVYLLENYIGRRTPLSLAENLSAELGHRIYLKREDLAHTGAHKINNALGQALLAQAMGKKRVIAETGAGQHGVATAAACALLGIECVIYMGSRDMERQHLNVLRMRLMGAKVVSVSSGSQTLKDAINDALRDWVAHANNSYYLLGSALGPHPYPTIVREFQSIIGREARAQFAAFEDGELPDVLIACVGGGSNAIGLFHPFLDCPSVQMFGIEAGGLGPESGAHSIRFGHSEESRLGVMQGCRSYVMQNANGQIMETHSIAPGLDYAMVGPEHALLYDSGRVRYLHATDDEALAALERLSLCEGIIPALESAHALAGAIKLAPSLTPNSRIIINISGRGDKDLAAIAERSSATQSQGGVV